MNHLDTRLFQRRKEWLRIASGRFHDLDSGIDYCSDVLFIGHRFDSRQDRQIDCERLVGQGADLDPLAAQAVAHQGRRDLTLGAVEVRHGGEALAHGGIANRVKVKLEWIESEIFEKEDPAPYLEGVNGILVPGGFGERGAEGKIAAATFARTRGVPYFGICFGMQMAVLEAARNLAGISDATSTEFHEADNPVVGLMTEWLNGNELETRRANGDLGGTMRLGAFQAKFKRDSKIAQIYGDTEISERHRHRYEVNMSYREKLEEAGMSFSGTSPDGLLPETVEVPDHPWFIGVQYHPELKSRPFDPHPLFASFIEAAVEQSRLV